MPVFEFRSRIDAAPEELFAWHSRRGAFERLAPPWERVRLLEWPACLEDGATTVIQLSKGPFRWRWVARLEACEAPRQFRDVQVQGPFASWVHTHRFVPADGGAVLEDHVDYRLPGGFAGAALGGAFVRRALERMFRFRHARTRDDLARHRAVAGRPSLRVLIGGASGLVGSALAEFLSSGGHDVRRLVRGAGAGPDEVAYDPARGVVDLDRLEGFDAIVHLGGANIGAGRWTPARRAQIRDSRVASTRLLAEAVAKLRRPPRVFLTASAIGYYGNRGEAPLTEDAPPGSGFLADVCREWEAAAAPAAQAGVRAVQLRTGAVLAASGGALPRMLPLFRAGLGGRVGDGRQVMSWIALDDLVGAIHFCLTADALNGAVNAVSPDAVTNAEFARTLGRVLRRPAALPAPAAAIRALLGEMGQALLLDGARVLPARLQAAGFRFLHARLDDAFAFELGLFTRN